MSSFAKPAAAAGDSLAPSRGILLGLTGGAAFWTALIWAVLRAGGVL